jgi:MFS family permease
VQRFSNGQSGLVFLAMTLIIGVLSPIGGKLADRLDVRLPILWGSLLMAASAVSLAFLTADSSLLYLLICLFGVGLGFGLCFPTINTALLRTVKPTEVNTASGIFTMGMMLGNTLGVIISTSLLVLIGSKKITALLNSEGFSLSTESSDKLLRILAKADHSAAQFADFASLQVPQLIKIVDEAFMAGFWPNMLMGAVFALIGGFWMWRQLGYSKQ